MRSPHITASRSTIAADCDFGEDVRIEADELEIGPGCRIGFSGADDFRTKPGVRIAVRRLVLGAGVQIGRSVRIEGGELRLDDGVRVNRGATIRVLDTLEIGAHGTVGEDCEISGRSVRVGQELWMLPGAKIGGGSAFETPSRLDIGHYVHLGVDTLINTARPVTIGHEVGLGTRTSIYTHGAYPSRLMGFPVSYAPVEIGDFTWIPGAIVNPGVRIGRNCVVGVNSLVTKNLPDGCLAAGSPAQVIKEGAYPRPLSRERRLAFFGDFLGAYATLLGSAAAPSIDDAGGSVTLEVGATVFAALVDDGLGALDRFRYRERVLAIGSQLTGSRPGSWTLLDTDSRRIAGAADGVSDKLVNELRRYGIRFYSRPAGAAYADWDVTVPRHLDGPERERDQAEGAAPGS